MPAPPLPTDAVDHPRVRGSGAPMEEALRTLASGCRPTDLDAPVHGAADALRTRVRATFEVERQVGFGLDLCHTAEQGLERLGGIAVFAQGSRLPQLSLGLL